MTWHWRASRRRACCPLAVLASRSCARRAQRAARQHHCHRIRLPQNHLQSPQRPSQSVVQKSHPLLWNLCSHMRFRSCLLSLQIVKAQRHTSLFGNVHSLRCTRSRRCLDRLDGWLGLTVIIDRKGDNVPGPGSTMDPRPPLLGTSAFAAVTAHLLTPRTVSILLLCTFA